MQLAHHSRPMPAPPAIPEQATEVKEHPAERMLREEKFHDTAGRAKGTIVVRARQKSDSGAGAR